MFWTPEPYDRAAHISLFFILLVKNRCDFASDLMHRGGHKQRKSKREQAVASTNRLDIQFIMDITKTNINLI